MPFNNIIDLIDSSSDSSSRRLPVLATMVQVFIPCPAQPDSWLLYAILLSSNLIAKSPAVTSGLAIAQLQSSELAGLKGEFDRRVCKGILSATLFFVIALSTCTRFSDTSLVFRAADDNGVKLSLSEQNVS